MKKLFSLVTVLLCAVMLSTTVFAANPDPIAVYKEYVKNSANISSMNLSMTQKISMINGEDTLDILKQDIAAKIIISPDDLQMEMRTVDTSTNDISTAYFRNNYLYQQVGEEKFKIKMDMKDALASAANIDVNLTEDILKDAKVQPLLDGVRVTYKTNLNDLKDGQGNPMADLLNNIDLPQDMKMSFSDITSSVTIGYDGVMKYGSNKFGIKVNSGDVNIELRINQTFRVNSVNTVDYIVFPADLSSYKLLEA